MTVLELPAAYDYLHVTPNSDLDAELQGMIDAAVATIERYLGGPAETRQVIEQVEQPIDLWRSIPLTYRPFVDLVSITANGQPVSTVDVYATPGRVLRRQFGLPFLPYWIRSWTVTYTAGLGAAAPAAVTLACKVIVGHLWSTQRGRVGGRGPSANDEYAAQGTIAPGFSFAVPNRALELLGPYAPESGLA